MSSLIFLDAIIQAELATSRAFSQAYDPDDTSSLISQLGRISSGIDDTSFNIASGIPGDRSQALFTTDTAATLERNVRNEHGDVERAVFENLAKYCVDSKETVEGYAIRACATVLSIGIRRGIFDMFCAGVPNEQNAFFLELYLRIRAEGSSLILSHSSLPSHSASEPLSLPTEPQDRAARWRSISFARAITSSQENDNAFTSTVTDELLANLALALAPFLSTPESSVKFLAPFRADVAKLTLQAVQWQVRTRRDFLSYDYETTLNHLRAGGEKGEVIAFVGFGLRQVKGVARDNPARIELEVHDLVQ